MKKMKKKIKKIENNAVPDKQRQQGERVADDVVDDRQFPNFMALSKREKLVFFESLHAARKNATVSGNKIKERFGTIHDEYLQYFGSVENNPGSESSKGSSGCSGINELDTNLQNGGSKNNPTQSNRENKGFGNSSTPFDQTQTKSPKRKRPRDDNSVKKKSCSRFVTKLPKLKGKESPKPQTEETQSDTSTSNKLQFETLKSDEKEIFLSILKEARDNILKECPEKYCEMVFMTNIVKSYEKPNEATPTKTEVPGRKKPCIKENVKENIKEKANNLRVKVDLNSSDSERIKKERLSKRKEISINSGKQRTEGEKEKTKKGTTASMEDDERSKATERKPVPSTDGFGKKQQRQDSLTVAEAEPKDNKKENVNKQKKEDPLKGSDEARQNRTNKKEGKVLAESERSVIKNLGEKQEIKQYLGSWRKIQIVKPKGKIEKARKREISPKSTQVEQNRQSTLVEEEVTEEIREDLLSLGKSLAETTEPSTETGETTETKPIETFFFVQNFKSTEDLENEVNDKAEESNVSDIVWLQKKISSNKLKEKTEKPKRERSPKREKKEHDKQSAVVEEEKQEVKEDLRSSGKGMMKAMKPPTETAEKVKTKAESIETLFFVDEFKYRKDVEDEGKDKTKETKESKIVRSQRKILLDKLKEKTEKPKQRERSPKSEQVEQDRESVLLEEDKQEKEMTNEVQENSRLFRRGTTETVKPSTEIGGSAETTSAKAQSMETFFFVVNFKSMEDVEDEVNNKTENTKESNYFGSWRRIQTNKEEVTEEVSSGEGMAETIEPLTETAETVKAEEQSIETFFLVEEFKSMDDVGEDEVNNKTEETMENKDQSEDSPSYRSFLYEFGEEMQSVEVESTGSEGTTPMGTMMIDEEITIGVKEDILITKTPSSMKLEVRSVSSELEICEQREPDVNLKRPSEKFKPLSLERRMEREGLGPLDTGDSFATNASSHSVTNDEDSVLQLWEELKLLKLSDSDCMMETQLMTPQMETENISGSRFPFFPDKNSQNRVYLAEEKLIVVGSENNIEEQSGRRLEAAVLGLHKSEGVIMVDGNAIEKIKSLVKALEKEAETKLEVKPDKENLNYEYNQLLLDYTDYLTRLLYLLTN